MEQTRVTTTRYTLCHASDDQPEAGKEEAPSLPTEPEEKAFARQLMDRTVAVFCLRL